MACWLGPGRVPNQSLTLLHVEDNERWSEWIAAVVGHIPEVTRFASAPNGARALAVARTLIPHVLLLDLRLPDYDGFVLATEFAQLPQPPHVLLLSARTDAVAHYRATRPPIDGMLWKSPGVAEQLPTAITEVASGRKYFSPEVRAAWRQLRADPHAFFKILSDRELELLPHLGAGREDGEIALELGISPATVRVHRQNIKRKLGLHNRGQLVHWAIRMGLVDEPNP